MKNLFVAIPLLVAIPYPAFCEEPQASSPKHHEYAPPVHFKTIAWNSKFDSSSETDRERRLFMRQYNALIPWHKNLTKLQSADRIGHLPVHDCLCAMARLRVQISQDLNDKKKELETLVFLLRSKEEFSSLELKGPLWPVDGPFRSMIPLDMSRISRVIAERIKSEEELAHVRLLLKKDGK